MKKSEEKIVVFDMDETLIHATKQKLSLPEDFTYEDFYVYKRPFLDTFLAECAKLCSIAIWSSADDEYVQGITGQFLDPSLNLAFVWGRSECWVKIVKEEDELTGLKRKRYQNIKPLEKIRRQGYNMENLLIVDDSRYKVKDNPQNYIIIPAFEGEQEDQALKTLLEALQKAMLRGTFTDLHL